MFAKLYTKTSCIREVELSSDIMQTEKAKETGCSFVMKVEIIR